MIEFIQFIALLTLTPTVFLLCLCGYLVWRDKSVSAGTKALNWLFCWLVATLLIGLFCQIEGHK